MTVHSGGKAYPIKVRFDADNTHAFTADIGGQQKTGKRGFDPDRAHALGRLLQVIDHPQRRLRDWDADLLLEQRIGGRHYTVVLKWEAGDTYRFSSAHFKTIEDVTRLFRRQNPRKNNGPLQKSEPSSAFPDASSPHGAGVIPFGVTSAALGSGQTSPHAEAAATFSIDHLNPLRKTAPMPMLLIFPNPAHHALVKAYIHGHYRLNAKTGQRHWVDSYTDKRPERGRASFTSTDHRVQHFDHHLTHGRQREALHVFHDLDHDESHKLALRLGLMHQTDPKGVDKKDLLESLHGAVRAKKAHTMKVGPYDKEEDAAFGREEKARKKADSAWITDRSPKQLVADGFIYSDTKQGYESAETAKRLVPIYRKRHPTADVVVTFDAQHQEATVWWAPKKPVSANANARLGHLAMDRVIADHDDVTQAMYREGPRWVSFYWGTAGNPKKGFAGGSGVAKIIAKRTAEGADGQAVARQMVEVIARGKVGEPYGPTGGERININHDGHTAVLSLVRFGKRESWLLTGWDDVASDGGKAVNASAAYAPDRSGMRDTAGAEPTSSVGQGIGEGKDAAPRPKPAEPAPAAREEIPDSAKQHFDSILGSAKRFGEGLDGARKTDAMFRGEGRYAAEAYSNMRETLESAYRSIGKQLDSIADPKRREIARQYFVEHLPNVDLTAKEADFFRGFKPVEKPDWMGEKTATKPARAAKPKASPAPDIAQLLKDPQTTRTDLDRALLKLTNRMNAALRAGDHVKSDALEAMKQQVRDAVPAAEERSRARLAEEHRKLKAPLAKSLPHIFPASR